VTPGVNICVKGATRTLGRLKRRSVPVKLQSSVIEDASAKRGKQMREELIKILEEEYHKKIKRGGSYVVYSGFPETKEQKEHEDRVFHDAYCKGIEFALEQLERIK
jgi:hypothetical protein